MQMNEPHEKKTARTQLKNVNKFQKCQVIKLNHNFVDAEELNKINGLACGRLAFLHPLPNIITYGFASPIHFWYRYVGRCMPPFFHFSISRFCSDYNDSAESLNVRKRKKSRKIDPWSWNLKKIISNYSRNCIFAYFHFRFLSPARYLHSIKYKHFLGPVILFSQKNARRKQKRPNP